MGPTRICSTVLRPTKRAVAFNASPVGPGPAVGDHDTHQEEKDTVFRRTRVICRLCNCGRRRNCLIIWWLDCFRMTTYDVRNYVEKIYKIPVLSVRDEHIRGMWWLCDLCHDYLSQESPADADKPARCGSMQKIAPIRRVSFHFTEFHFAKFQITGAWRHSIGSRPRPIWLYIVWNPVFANCSNYKYLVLRLFCLLHTE